jgi:hypothetical protein
MTDNAEKLAYTFLEIIERFREQVEELVEENGFLPVEVLVGLYYMAKTQRQAAYDHLMQMESKDREEILQGLTIEQYLDTIRQGAERLAESTK